MKTLAHRWAPSVVIQALGPLCAFATVFVVARLGGAAAQGRFAQTKAWVDLLVALGCFGFPQSIVYVVNRLGASASRLAWACLAYGAAFLPVAWGVTVLGLAHGWTGPALDGGAAGAWVPALAGALLVLHGLLRGVFLTQAQGAAFALFTILPATSLLLFVAVARGQGAYVLLILAAAAVSALVGSVMTVARLRRAAAGSSPLSPGSPSTTAAAAATPWRALLSNGTQVFLQAVLAVLQPLLAYTMIRHLGGGDADVGHLNAGVFLVQGLIVPIGLVAPLMFARWTSSHDSGLLHRLHGRSPRWLAAGGAIGVAIALVVPWLVPPLFGAGYRGAVLPVALLMLTVPQAAHSRLLAPALHASGHPGVNTTASAIRLAALGLVALALVHARVDTLAAVAVAWSGGEVLGLAWVLWALRRLTAGARA